MREVSVPVADGSVPVHVADAAPGERAPSLPAVLCVPSIFGPADELLAQLAGLTDVATVAVMDPFWRVEAGAIPYADRDGAFARVGQHDRAATEGDLGAVARWLAERSNGSVIGLGICFGGPWVLLGASVGALAGVVTWHGSRMEQVIDRLDPSAMTGPVRLHFGEVDPITPPEAIAAIEACFADHPDCSIVVHPGLDHGFSHEGPAWDADATAAGLADLRAVAVALAS
jgi:carboxymethylenebutenolidase